MTFIIYFPQTNTALENSVKNWNAAKYCVVLAMCGFGFLTTNADFMFETFLIQCCTNFPAYQS